MKKYIACVRNKETKELMVMEREYKRAADFESDLRGNGYAIRFITTEEKFDEACEKWHRRNEFAKFVSRELTKAGCQKWQLDRLF